MSAPSSHDDDLRRRLREFLEKVTDLVAGKPGIDLLAGLGSGDEIDSLALAVHILRRAPGDVGVPADVLPWQALFDAAPVAQCLVGEDGAISHANRAWRQAFGEPGRMLAAVAVQSRLVDVWWTRRPQANAVRAPWIIEVELRVARGGAQTGRLLAWPDAEGRIWQVLAELTGERKAATKVESPARRPRILVVDDDAIVRSVTGELLDACGFDCMPVPGGPQALSLFEHGIPDVDLLLIDLSMPHVTGPEVVERLGARLDGIPIVFMTGFLDPDQAAQLQARHHAQVLRKPFALTDLVDVLETAFAGRGRRP